MPTVIHILTYKLMMIIPTVLHAQSIKDYYILVLWSSRGPWYRRPRQVGAISERGMQPIAYAQAHYAMADGIAPTLGLESCIVHMIEKYIIA